MKLIYFLNGKFILSKKAYILADDPGLLRGMGLFETMRAYKGRIVYLESHLRRLLDSADLLCIKIPYSKARLEGIIKETIRLNNISDSCIRLIVWRMQHGTGVLVTIKKYYPYRKERYKNGFSVCVSELRQDEESVSSKIKTISRAFYELSYNTARDNGFDEAIMLNKKGFICEATRSNLFFIKSSQLFTPELSCGCLPGVTREFIIDKAKGCGFKVNEGKFRIKNLLDSDEAFLTNSLMGIMPLKSVNKRNLSRNKNDFKITKIFLKEYNYYLKGIC